MIPLKIGCHDYDNTHALLDGTVTIDGVDGTFESTQVISDVFERMVRHQEFDVAELGLTFYLRTLDIADPPFIAIPIFPNRIFRHSCIFVNTESGIHTPKDLAGKTVGEFAIYGQDSGVWAKGILSDDYGVTPDRSRWVIGGLDQPMTPFDFVPRPHPADVDVTQAPEGKSLGNMLETGEIDALVSANAPRCFLDGSPKVARLFPDYEQVERDYYRRTGIFPTMHTIVIRRDLVAQHPELAKSVYHGFDDAKNNAVEHYLSSRRIYQVDTMIPWLNRLFEENLSLLQRDWWPSGVEANRTAIDTFLRYHYEQGLSQRRLKAEDIFAPELLDT